MYRLSGDKPVGMQLRQSIWCLVTCFLVCSMAASRVRGAELLEIEGKVVYNQVVASQKTERDYWEQVDLFSQEFPSGQIVRLTDYAKHPLLSKYRCISQPEWSPDGWRVLFWAVGKIGSSGDRSRFPWILDARTGHLEMLKQYPNRWYLRIKWLSDSRRLVALVKDGPIPSNPEDRWNYFLSTGPDSRIVAIDLETKREHVIMRNPPSPFYLPSPNGNDVLFYHSTYRTLYTISIPNHTKRKIFGVPDLDAAAFSPDGKRLALYGGGELRVCNIDTGKMLIIQDGLVDGTEVSDLHWSPDGKWVAFKQHGSHIQSVDPPLVDSSSYITAVNVGTGKAVGFPDPKAGANQESGYLIVLGWTKDSKYLILRDTGKSTKEPYPRDVRYALTAYPIGGGPAVPVTQMIGYLYDVDWLPR